MMGQKIDQPVIAGALFDFCGYLTTLDEPIELGGSKDATPCVRHLEKWAEKRALDLDNPLVKEWRQLVE